MRALLPYLPILLAVGLTIYTVIDIALIDPLRVKGLPKIVWIADLPSSCSSSARCSGSCSAASASSRATPAAASDPGPRRGPVAPDDDPDFLGKLSREQAQEERIRDLEQRLREIDDDPEDKPKE